MSSNPSEEKRIQDQIEALLDLLPTLKAELRFAGCGDNTHILTRIEQAYSELKQVQEAPANMQDPFACDIKKPVSELKQYQFIEPVYHSDGMGHIQVQVLENDQPYALDRLLEQIEVINDWDACFAMLEEQPRLWLLHFTEQLGNNTCYHTQCQIKIISLLTERSDIIAVLQTADRWYWDKSNSHLIPELIKKAETLLNHHYFDDLEREIDTSILTTVKINLESLYKRLTI